MAATVSRRVVLRSLLLLPAVVSLAPALTSAQGAPQHQQAPVVAQGARQNIAGASASALDSPPALAWTILETSSPGAFLPGDCQTGLGGRDFADGAYIQ